MMDQQTLRARWVLPITGEPIENGEVVVRGGRIEAVRRCAPGMAGDASVVDLGEAALLPGLVNVHTHLDYTVMRGLIEDIDFFPWVRELQARKSALTPEDWRHSAVMGAAEAVAGGVTTLGDCTDSGAALFGVRELGLRGVIFQEVFGIDELRSVPEIMTELRERVRQLREAAVGAPLEVGISPHSPYTVRPALYAALRAYMDEEPLRCCIHAAESPAEAELTQSGTGPIAAMYARRGIEWQVPHCSPVAYLHRMGMLTPRTLLVHGIQLSASDTKLAHDCGAAWAHCPKSNAKLANGIGSFDLLRRCSPAAARRIGIGSDSVASNNTMDLFEEMRFAVLVQRARGRRFNALGAREVLEAATIGGARALGLDGEIGSLEPGKQADLTAVRLDGISNAPCYDPYSTLVYASSARDVCLTMVAGRALYQDGSFITFDPKEHRAAFQAAAARLRAWQPPTGPL